MAVQRENFFDPVQQNAVPHGDVQMYNDLSARLQQFQSQVAGVAIQGIRQERQDALTAYSAETTLEVFKKVPEIAAQARAPRDDGLSPIEYFDAAAGGLLRGMTTNAPAVLKADIELFTSRSLASERDRLVTEVVKQETEVAQTQLNAALDELAAKASQAFANGDEDAAGNYMDTYEKLITSGLESNLLGAKDAQTRLQKDSQTQQVYTIVGRFEKAYQEDQGLAFVEQFSRKVPDGMSAETHKKALNEIESRFTAHETRKSKAESDVKEAATVAALELTDSITDQIAAGNIPSTAQINDLYDAGRLGEGPDAVRRMTSLKNQVRAAEEKQGQIADIGLALANGQRLPKNEGNKKAADAWLGQQDDPVQAGADLAKTVGWVPPVIDNAMRGSARAQATLVEGAALYRAIYDDPSIHPDTALPVGDMALLASTAALLDKGVNPEQAAEIAWNSANLDENSKLRRDAAWKQDSEKQIETAQDNLVQSYRDFGFFEGEPDLPLNMQVDFNQVYRQAYDATGDWTVAQRVAMNATRQQWALTNINGGWEFQNGGLPGGEILRERFNAEAEGLAAVVVDPSGMDAENITVNPGRIRLEPPPQPDARVNGKGERVYLLYDGERLLMGKTEDGRLAPLTYTANENDIVQSELESATLKPLDEQISGLSREVDDLSKRLADYESRGQLNDPAFKRRNERLQRDLAAQQKALEVVTKERAAQKQRLQELVNADSGQ